MPSTSTTRCYPPGGAATSVTVQSLAGLVGYAALINAAADAQQVDAPALQALNWLVPESLVGSGTTAQRPPAQTNKLKFYADTTLAAFIWSDGLVWRTFAGAVA